MAKDKIQEKTVGIVEPHTIKLDLPPGGFRLEKGGVLPEIQVAYERCGHITPENDNVVFIRSEEHTSELQSLA